MSLAVIVQVLQSCYSKTVLMYNKSMPFSISLPVTKMQITKLMKKKGTSMVMIDGAGAGDIVSMAGLTSPSIGHTVANVEVLHASYVSYPLCTFLAFVSTITGSVASNM